MLKFNNRGIVLNLIRIITIILFFIFTFAQRGFCADDFRIKNLIVDNSDKVILIQGKGNYKTTQSASSYTPIPGNNPNSVNLINDISTFTITSPNRYVIDIPNATLENASRTYTINNSDTLTNIIMSQFSVKPNIVRVVLTCKNMDDFKKFSIFSNGSNIIIKYKQNILDNSIQYKFYTPTGDMTQNTIPQDTGMVVKFNNNDETIDLTPRFQTKYYLSQISQNTDGIILRGLGSISYQRIEYSFDNTKAVIYLDNAAVASRISDKIYKIPSLKKDLRATLAIQKYNARKVKLTLSADNVRDYRFIISPDGQSMFISHRSYVINTTFSQHPSIIKDYKVATTANDYRVFEFLFDKSVAYDVFEYNNNFYLDVNNLGDYNEQLFKNTFNNYDIKVEAIKISSDKTRFIIPMDKMNFAYANVESNTKSIKICFKNKPSSEITPKKQDQGLIVVQNKTDNKDEVTAKSENINVNYIPKDEDKNEEIKTSKFRKKDSSLSSMKKVVIDPGHGGSDSGAIGGGIYEKNLNLEVAKLVQQKLNKKGIYVYMTRSKDETLTLEDRVNFSNEIDPDIYVSIHTNSTVQEDAFGLETHYFKDDSLDLAKTIHASFASEKNLKKWDTKDRGVFKSRFYVINHTEAPSILIEMGFISNLNERALLIKKSHQDDIADAIVEGILEYLK